MNALTRIGLALSALAATSLCAHAADTSEARVIVKLKASSTLKQIQAAGRVETLGSRLGLTAHMVSQPGRDLHVMRASA
jgi:hypothetical protein